MKRHDADSALPEGADKLSGSRGTADIEDAMWHCEQLLLQVDAGVRRIGVTEALGVGLSAVVALAAVLSAIGSGGSAAAWIAALCGGGAVIAIEALLVFRLLSRIREQVKRDALVMADIVNVQREVVPLISREEKWSPSRLSLMQKRLERFPIDAESILGRRGRVSAS
jgi:hypothetical protein